MAYMRIFHTQRKEENLSLDVSAVNRFFAATAISSHSLPLTHFSSYDVYQSFNIRHARDTPVLMCLLGNNSK